MRYIGSKTATLPWLSQMIRARAPCATSLLDPFAGTCTVARHFKRAGFRVTTGDTLNLSYVLQVATVQLDAPPTFGRLLKALKLHALQDDLPAARVLAHLNVMLGEPGYVTRNFSPEGPAGRLYFTSANARRIDAIRSAVRAWRESDLLGTQEHAYLLAVLIEASDRVANTAGTYYAHLKRVSRKAAGSLWLTLPSLHSGNQPASCHHDDAPRCGRGRDRRRTLPRSAV